MNSDSKVKVFLRQPSAGSNIPPPCDLNIADAITVEAWVNAREPRAEIMQSIVAKWSSLSSFNTFEAYDAGNTSGLATRGFLGAVFDGRYVYFVPEFETDNSHGRVLRYDTHGGFKDPMSWTGYDAGQTD